MRSVCKKIKKIRKFIINSASREATTGLFFVLLFIMLFLGDGKEAVVDAAGAASVIVVYVIARFYQTKQRELPRKINLLWTIFLGYIFIRTAFSIDVGYSVYAFVRYLEAYVVFWIFYSYSTKKTIIVFKKTLLTFTFISVIAATFYTLIPFLHTAIPKTNLLYPAYGHNHAVSILLFVTPAVFLDLLINQKNRKENLLLLVVFLSGIIFSYARIAMVLVALFIVIVIVGRVKNSLKTKKPALIMGLVFTLSALFVLFSPNFIQPQKQKQIFFINKPKEKIIDRARFKYWKQATVSVAENPIFGSGPGTFIIQSRRLQEKYLNSSWYVHNHILQLVSDTGIAGLGLFGAVLLLIVLPIIKSYRKNDDLFKGFCWGLVLVGTYSLFDFNLDFLVIWLLFFATLGFLSALSHKGAKETKFNYVVVMCLFGLSVFYITYLLSMVFQTQSNFKTAFLSAPYRKVTALGLIKENIKNNKTETPKIERLIYIFHKNKEDVMLALADYYKQRKDIDRVIGCYQSALRQLPLNTDTYSRYTDFLIQSNRKNELGNFIMWGPSNVLAQKSNLKAEEINFKDELLIKHFNKEMFIRPPKVSPEEYFAVLFYLIGLSVIEERPDTTEKLWLDAKDLAPQWGHFHVELASFKMHIKNEKAAAKDVLTRCQDHDSPAQQCFDAQTNGLEIPGSLVEKIKKIPIPL